MAKVASPDALHQNSQEEFDDHQPGLTRIKVTEFLSSFAVWTGLPNLIVHMTTMPAERLTLQNVGIDLLAVILGMSTLLAINGNQELKGSKHMAAASGMFVAGGLFALQHISELAEVSRKLLGH